MKKLLLLVMLIMSVTPFGFGQNVSEGSSNNSEVIYFSEKEIILVFNQSIYLNPQVKNLDQVLIAGSRIQFKIEGVVTPITAKTGDSPRNILKRGISKEYWTHCKDVQESLKDNALSIKNPQTSIGRMGIVAIVLLILIIIARMAYLFFNKKNYPVKKRYEI